MSYTISLLSFVLGVMFYRAYAYYQSGAYKQAFQNDRAIYAALHRILEQTEANRVSICSVSNGGGEMKVGQNKYYTTVYEVTDEALPYSRDTYQRILLHESDIQELSVVQRDGTAWHTVPAEPQRGILAQRFKADGVLYYHLSHIKISSKTAFFLLLESTQPEGLLVPPKAMEVYNTSYNAIKQIFDMSYSSPITIRI